MTKNVKQGMNRVENDMHTAQQTSRTGQGIAHLLRTAILGLILTMGLSLGYGQAQAEEGGKDTRQVQRHDREQADKAKGEDRRADDALPSIVLTAPANNVSLYPASIAVDAAVSFPGKAEGRNGKREGVEIEFLVDGRKFAEAERAPYRASYTPPQAGIYTLSARIRYGEGRRTIQSNSVEIVSDLPPTVSLTTPANNTVLTAPATFILTAGAAAQIGSIAKVEFYNGTSLIGTATGAPYTYTWNNVPAGSYTVTAKATDNYGISNTSAPVSVVSNAAPTVSLTGPAPNTVSVAPGSFTLTANALDSDGAITKVEFYGNGSLIGSATAAPYSVTWSNVPAGSYSITAIATDNNGASTTSAAVPVISDAPPTVSLTGPAANAGYTTPSAITLDATAADSDGTITKVDFYNGATLLGTATAAPYTYTWTNAPVGSHSLTVIATDNLGASATSAATTVTVIAPPVVSLSTPANAVLTAPASFTLSADATSAGSIAKVEFYNGATLIGTATTAPYSFDWTNVPAGSYSITAVATDGNGATTTSAPVSVTANAAPAVSLTSPVANSILAAPASFTLTADATDTDGTIAQVDFYNGTTLIGTATAAPYSFDWTNVLAGSYTITALATDNHGASTTSAAVAVTSNQLPIISLTGPAANTVSVAPGSFTLTADAADADGSIAKVDFHADGILIGTATAAPYSYTWTNVPAGPHTLTAIATDNLAGQTASATVPVISDAPPAVSLTSPAANAVSVAPGSFTLTVDATSTTSSIAKVEYYAGNAGTNTLIGTATTAPYSFDWTNVPAGTYSLTAVATDALGTATTSAAITVTSDQAPSVTLTGPAAGSRITSPNSFTLTATANSVTSSIAKVEFYANDGQANTLVGTATAAPYSVTWANVPVGNYELSAIATDGFGIATTSAAVAVSAIANVPPTVSLTGPANGTTMKVPGSFTLTADAASTTSAIAKVDFYAIDNATNASTLIGTASQAPYTANWSNVPLGDYTLSAVATDTLGAVTTSSQVSVTVNTGIAQAYYIHADHLDTPRTITDAAGNVVWQWDNTDPFGANMANENPNGAGQFGFNLRFPGQYFDRETNLDYNVNRDYDPNIGRYIESDPIGLRGGINTYIYVGGNPLSRIDPRGTEWSLGSAIKWGAWPYRIWEGANYAANHPGPTETDAPQYGGGGAGDCWGEECDKCKEDAHSRYETCEKASQNSCPTETGLSNKCVAQYMVDIQVCKVGGGRSQGHGASGKW